MTHQLGRDPQPFRVAARCPYGLPSVIENEPSRNMPTRFWLTCQHLDRAIARVEAAGGVKRAQEELGEGTVQEIHDQHYERYGHRVAGVRQAGYVKCLHAFTAMHLSGAIPNAVAVWTLDHIKEPYPTEGCCTESGG